MAPRRRRHPSTARLLARAALLALSTGLAAPALAQTVGFDPADYGRAQLPLRQTTGDVAAYVESNKGAFEPIAELDPKDPLAVLARPIGRLDVVLTGGPKPVGASCTAALLPGDLILTNHHCLPQSGDLRPAKASIVMDYLTLDGAGARRFEVEAKPVEFDARLDYAIARVAGGPAATYGTVRLSGEAVPGNRSLLVIHHPLGRPKVMSRFRCFAMKDQPPGPDLRHRCDTLGGSSGSLMFDGAVAGVALHKEGGLDPRDTTSFNNATRLAAILKASRVLAEVVAAQGGGAATPGPTAAPASGRDPGPAPAAVPADRPAAAAPSDTDRMNAILRGQ
jgi:V8-like Glu-specific endopeptidase